MFFFDQRYFLFILGYLFDSIFHNLVIIRVDKIQDRFSYQIFGRSRSKYSCTCRIRKNDYSVHMDQDAIRREFDQLAVFFLALAPGFLRLFACSDIEHNAVDQVGLTALIPQHTGSVANPNHPSIARKQSILAFEGFARVNMVLVIHQHPLPIFHVNGLGP